MLNHTHVCTHANKLCAFLITIGTIHVFCRDGMWLNGVSWEKWYCRRTTDSQVSSWEVRSVQEGWGRRDASRFSSQAGKVVSFL